MSSRPIQNIVIFGATGDLAARMLLPSLYFLDADGLLPEGLKIVGSARSRDGPRTPSPSGSARPWTSGPRRWTRRPGRASAIGSTTAPADVSKDGGVDALAERLGRDSVNIYYLALSPSVYGAACARLQAAGLACGDCRIVLEKPIGRDLASSKAINDEVGQRVRRAEDLPRSTTTSARRRCRT